MFQKLKNKFEDYFFSHFAMTRRQRGGFLFLVILITAAELIILYFPFDPKSSEIPAFKPTEEVIALQLNSQQQEKELNPAFSEQKLTTFNPNALDAAGFEALGFSSKQASSLLKYRNSLGGNFSSVEEFKNAYVMSDWMFERIKNHVDLKPFEKNLIQKHYTQKRSNSHFESKWAKSLKPFYINRLGHSEIMNLGFSEKQAQAVLNYKNSLPGKKFTNLGQFQKCFVVNDYMFNKLEPFIRFETENSSQNTENNTRVKDGKSATFNPNEMTEKQWGQLGFDKSTAADIIKYRDFIEGFNSLEDVRQCRYISEEDFLRIKDQLKF